MSNLAVVMIHTEDRERCAYAERAVRTEPAYVNGRNLRNHSR
jgi:hypothetical protein